MKPRFSTKTSTARCYQGPAILPGRQEAPKAGVLGRPAVDGTVVPESRAMPARGRMQGHRAIGTSSNSVGMSSFPSREGLRGRVWEQAIFSY